MPLTSALVMAFEHPAIDFFVDDEVRQTTGSQERNAHVLRPALNRMQDRTAKLGAARGSGLVRGIEGIDEDRDARDHPIQHDLPAQKAERVRGLIIRQALHRAQIEIPSPGFRE